MKRGGIWSVAGGSSYTGKPRPAVIVQEDAFAATDSVALCVFTSDPTEAPLLRVRVQPSDHNGLTATARLMVDKLVSVPRQRLGRRPGMLDDADVQRLNRAMLVLLGLVGTRRRASA